MYQVDLTSKKPIYEQIVDQTQNFILSGVLKVGDKLPSVRSLSVKLSVNPNTIARAYNELSLKNIIISSAGKGFFVSNEAQDNILKSSYKQLNSLDRILLELRNLKIDKDTVIKRVEKIYSKEADE